MNLNPSSDLGVVNYMVLYYRTITSQQVYERVEHEVYWRCMNYLTNEIATNNVCQLVRDRFVETANGTR